MERYDRVNSTQIGQEYKLPVLTGTYDSKNATRDRRYPQQRVGSSQYDLSGPLEMVPTAPTKTFEDLFTYNKEKTEAVRPVIEADGSTICNIYLQRKIFRFVFNYTEPQHKYATDHYLYGKWDQEIYDNTLVDIWDPRYPNDHSTERKQLGFNQHSSEAGSNT